MHFNFIFLIIYILMLTTKSAHAYLDPGTFTIVVNFIIALFAGIIAYITMFWIKIKNFFSKIFKKKKNKE